MLATKTNLIKLCLGLLILSVLAFLLSLSIGSVDIFNSDQALQNHILALRFNRSINAFNVGALLGLAGVIMQVLLKNPLADPYILGVSGGASVGALGAISLGLGFFWINTYAFIGAILSILLVFKLAQQYYQNTSRLILIGVALGMAWGAVIKLLLTFNEQIKLKSMITWLMGDLSAISLDKTLLVVALVALILGIAWSKKMNLMGLGNQTAQSLGLNARLSQYQLYFLASLTTAIATTSAGIIGFVGLVIPHILRLLGITDHRLLVLGSMFSGGIFLLLADSIARTVLTPIQLPTGVITTLIGVPIFLYLLRR